MSVGYDKADQRAIFKAFKAMDDEAVDQAKKVSNGLAFKMSEYIKGAARNSSRRAANTKIADQVKVSPSSKVGEFAYGYKSQRNFSGGASTLDMLYGSEFGSINYPRFPERSPRLGRGNAGYFIFPTLRSKQPEIVREWEDAFSRIVKEFI
jgi:hypothetical protein